jgi:hypothetical protein
MDVLSIYLKGVVFIIIGCVSLLLGWLDLKGGRGLIRTVVLVLFGLFFIFCGIVMLTQPSGSGT